LSTIFAGLHGHEWKGFKSFFTVFIFGWTFARSQYSKETMKKLFILAILTLIPPLIFGLYQMLWTKENWFLKINSVGMLNASGLYFMLITLVSFGYFLSIKQKIFSSSHFKFWFLINGFFWCSFLYEGSRSAFIALFVGIIVLLGFLKNNYKKMYFALFGIFVLSAFLIQTQAIKRHEGVVKDNNVLSYRDKLWNVSMESIRLFSDKFGIGLDNYTFVDESVVKPAVEGRGEVYDAKNYYYSSLTHNVYLSFLVERGFLGFFSLMTLFIFWATQIFRNIKRLGLNQQHDYLWGGSTSAFLSVFLVGLVHTTLVHEPGILALFFFGLYHMFTKFYVNKKA
jgi:O-antigen ligase